MNEHLARAIGYITFIVFIISFIKCAMEENKLQLQKIEQKKIIWKYWKLFCGFVAYFD